VGEVRKRKEIKGGKDSVNREETQGKIGLLSSLDCWGGERGDY